MQDLTWTRVVGVHRASVPDPLEFVAVITRTDAGWWWLHVTTHGRPLHNAYHRLLAEAKADANRTWLAVAQ